MNPRSAQMLTGTLAVLLIVLVGATLFILLSRPPAVGPSPSPTVPASFPSQSPTAVAFISPSPSAAVSSAPTSEPITPSPEITAAPRPTATPTAAQSIPPSDAATSEPTPTATPTLPPTPTPTPTVPPTPSPTPTPEPTVSPTSPDRDMWVVNVGLDKKNIEGSVPRFVTFNVDGPSLLAVHLSDATGSVRLCVFRDDTNDERECHTVRNGGFDKPVFDEGSTTWTVSMIGTDPNVSPSATLHVHFNAAAPRVTLDSFRYVGTQDNNYNGFLAQVSSTGDGSMRVQAAFDDGQNGQYTWHLVIQPSGDAVFDQMGGPSQSIDFTQAVTATDYHVSVRVPDEVASPILPVFVTATISWP